jgi:hypothetical protein
MTAMGMFLSRRPTILHEFDTEKLYRMDATFRVVRGLADSQSVSFESYNYPGHYICYNSREGTVELKIESRKVLIEEDRTKDATFLIAHPLHES